MVLATGKLGLTAFRLAIGAAIISNAVLTGPAWVATAEAAQSGTLITGLTDRTAQISRIGPIHFLVSDDNTPAENLVVTASSSNQAVVPDANLILRGSYGSRSLLVTPAAVGSTVVTVSVDDGTNTTSASFTLNLLANYTYYLAEGATGTFFDTDITIGSPHNQLISARLTFLKDDGTSVEVNTNLFPPNSRQTIRVDDIAGLEATSFSVRVEPHQVGAELIVERTMRWDASGYGAHTEKATFGPSSEWFFAEGAQGFFFTYFLLVNPQPTANTAHITYLREGAPPITRDYPMLPSSRLTVYAGDDPALVDMAFGARVEFDQPGMAERSMYFGTSPLFAGGHASAGATTPAQEWLLAEGATGSFFSTFVLIANPNDEPAEVTLTYLRDAGPPVVKVVTVPGGQRETRNIATEDEGLTHASVGVRVQSTQPVVVERSQYWPNPADTWYEAHNSFGVTEAGQRWGLSEGSVGGPKDARSYLLLANPGPNPAQAEITMLTTEGAVPPVVKTFTVLPASRLTVAVDLDVPELQNETFGAVIDSSEPIVVERSLYESVPGAFGFAGTNATATRMVTIAPVAYVGPDQVNLAVGSTVSLTGVPPLAVGPDPELAYQWTLVQRPPGSAAALTGAQTASPSFVVDVAGDYVAQLVVSRKFLKSAPEAVFISTNRPPVDVSVSVTDDLVDEAGNSGTFAFTRSGGDLTQPLTIPFAFLNPSEVPVGVTTAVPGEDYPDFGVKPTGLFTTFYDRTLTFPANETTVVVTVTPTADTFAEDPEILGVRILPRRDYVIVGTNPQNFTIVDSNTPEVGVITLPNTAFESQGTQVTLRFNRIGGNLAVGFTANLEIAGTATGGVDYTPALGATVTFLPNEKVATLTLTPVNDGAPEAPETVTIKVLPGMGYVPGGRPEDRIDILDQP